MHRRPDRGHPHAKVAVAADRNRQASRAFERKRRADRNAGSGADAASALRADVIEGMVEWPGSAVPGERQMRERDRSVADRGLERLGQIVDPQWAARWLVY